jgi:signal transduction histidine kinase
MEILVFSSGDQPKNSGKVARTSWAGLGRVGELGQAMQTKGAFLTILLLVFPLAGGAGARETFVTCSAVRSMSPVEAGKFWRVDLSGVVVCRTGGGKGGFVVQDGTGNVFVELSQKSKPGMLEGLAVGTQVKVRGFTFMGDYSPRVKADAVVPTGESPLPAPVLLEAGEVVDGKYEDRYVEFNAVVRDGGVEEGKDGRHLVMGFGPANRRISVRVWLPDGVTVPVVGTDDLVRIRGMVMERKVSGTPQVATLVIADQVEGLEVLFRAAAELSGIPETPVSVLLAQGHDPFLERRRKITGVVTLAWPDRLVVVQKENHAIRISPSPGLKLTPGDRVEVAGIPTLYEDGLLMEQAVFSAPQPGSLPDPEPVQRREMAGDAGMERDSRFLSLGGVVVETGHRERDHAISVESDHGIFRCVLPRSQPLPEGVESGAYVEVTGICRLLYGWEAGRKLDDFEILLPDAGSIRVRTVPSWWTPWRLGAVFAGAGISVAGLLAWGMLLRRKVRVRTDLLAREMHFRRENELITGERSRLAMELHDGVSQVLSAAAFQLEAATRDLPQEEGEENRLRLVKKLLEHGREDLRRAVWDLTPGSLEKLGLHAALEKLAESANVEGGPAVVLSAADGVNDIPSRVRAHLFRLIQEGTTNAVRHSGATVIHISVAMDGGWISVEIRDDGHGFDPAASPGPGEGHFGLYSMKSRVGLLKGEMNLESSPAGTSILVRIPSTSMPESMDTL